MQINSTSQKPAFGCNNCRLGQTVMRFLRKNSVPQKEARDYLNFVAPADNANAHEKKMGMIFYGIIKNGKEIVKTLIRKAKRDSGKIVTDYGTTFRKCG